MTKYVLPFVAVLGAVIAYAAVNTDYDHSADFGQYKTYSWIKVEAGDLWQDRITQDVDSQLAAKGWTKVSSGGDSGVAAMGAVRNQQTLETFYEPFGGGWFWRGFGGDGVATTQVENTPVGMLVVDIFDARTKKLIWRGRASETLSSKPDKNDKKLEKSVEDLFKSFPPQSKG